MTEHLNALSSGPDHKGERGFSVTRLESPLEQIEEALPLRDALAREEGQDAPENIGANTEEKLREKGRAFEDDKDIFLEMRQNGRMVGFLTARVEHDTLEVHDLRIDERTHEERVVENLFEELYLEAGEAHVERIKIAIPESERHVIDTLLREGMQIDEEGDGLTHLSMRVGD